MRERTRSKLDTRLSLLQRANEGCAVLEKCQNFRRPSCSHVCLSVCVPVCLPACLIGLSRMWAWLVLNANILCLFSGKNKRFPTFVKRKFIFSPLFFSRSLWWPRIWQPRDLLRKNWGQLQMLFGLKKNPSAILKIKSAETNYSIRRSFFRCFTCTPDQAVQYFKAPKFADWRFLTS